MDAETFVDCGSLSPSVVLDAFTLERSRKSPSANESAAAKSVVVTMSSVISLESIAVPSAESIVIEPPSATAPPPESPVPAVTVTLEFVRSPLAIEASCTSVPVIVPSVISLESIVALNGLLIATTPEPVPMYKVSPSVSQEICPSAVAADTFVACGSFNPSLVPEALIDERSRKSPSANASVPVRSAVPTVLSSISDVSIVDPSTAARLTEPPSETAPPPESPVPAVTVTEEFASSVLSICPAGNDTVPAETVKPDAVTEPASVKAPEDVKVFNDEKKRRSPVPVP